ncbi:MAG: hypothetical protein A2W85_06300 [Bacteroidetes bacterium GWF2_41_31]|nr:MAG: hypothetical protein A2W85_06300 [Bacteroidetes bacterium GWF2_41_31]
MNIDEMNEFCKDMPESKPVNPANYIPIDLYPGHRFYVGEPHGAFSLNIQALIRVSRRDTREMRRLFEQWYILYPDKNFLLRQIRRFIVEERKKAYWSHNQPQPQLEALSEFVDEHQEEKEGTQPKGIQCLEQYTPDKLGKIFDNLKSKCIVNKPDKITFLSIFDNPQGIVFWNANIHGSQAGLFDLMERITGKEFTATELKLYFRAIKPIHDNWNGKTQTRLIDFVMK